jgi:Xaa-Pro aminopeptidase
MTDKVLQFGGVTSLPTPVLPMRKRNEVINRIVKKRLDTILPMAMRETGFDMWLVLCAEDNLDPVFKTMMPMDTWFPIVQMLIFFDRGDQGVERINLSRTKKTEDFYDVPYTVQTYNVQKADQQWVWLRELIEARDPKRIAINQSEVIWAADGLSATLKDSLIDVLPKKYVERLASGEDLCRRWLETLSEDELEIYPHVMSVAHSILREMYSRKNIVPGVTTTEDLKWAFWERCADLNVTNEAAFTSRFEIARSDEMTEKYGPDDITIRHGDLVYCDAGIYYLRLITDTVQWAYVLREGETDVPDSFKNIMADCNRLEDIYVGEFVQGRTGNEILQAALTKARQEGLNNPRIYSHSCGLLLHEPGPLIGHPFEQEFCIGRGEVPLNYNSTFVAELSVDGVVPEWGDQTIRFPLESQIMFTQDGVEFIDGRQTTFYLI